MFYKEMEIESQLNTNTMWRHSLAFGLYLLAVLMNFFAYTKYVKIDN